MISGKISKPTTQPGNVISVSVLYIIFFSTKSVTLQERQYRIKQKQKQKKNNLLLELWKQCQMIEPLKVQGR